MDCLFEEVVVALEGGVAAHGAMVVPPPQLDGRPRRSAASKALLGEPLAHRIDTADVTVQWADDDIDEAYAAEVAATAQDAWTRLFVDAGWPTPAGSDRYLQWILLDRTVPGSGYTTLYTTEELPDGYPVIFLNPGYGDEDWPGYSLSVAVHELGHTSQFAMRDPSLAHTWFWESSAEWMAELGAPDLDTYALSTWAYAEAPEDSYSSATDQHPYGMLLLPAYADEYIGEGTLRSVWTSEDGPEDAYAAVAGVPFATLLADMTGAYAARALRESSLYYTPTFAEELDGAPEDLELEPPDPGGTVYVRISAGAADVEVDGTGEARWAADGTWGESPPATGETILAYTTFDHARWRIGTFPDAPPPAEEAPGGCACGASGGVAAWPWLVGLFALRARRQAGACV